MDPCYIYEEQFGIHESICLAATQVPGVCFKVSFKLRLFAWANPGSILTAINKTFKNYHWGCGCALSRGKSITVSPEEDSWHLNRLCHSALCRDWLHRSSLPPVPQFPNEFPVFFREVLSPMQNKWWLGQHLPVPHVSPFKAACSTLTGTGFGRVAGSHKGEARQKPIIWC